MSIINVNTNKKISCYARRQQLAARVLLIFWLLASSSPEPALAVSKCQPAIGLGAKASPQYAARRLLILGLGLLATSVSPQDTLKRAQVLYHPNLVTLPGSPWDYVLPNDWPEVATDLEELTKAEQQQLQDGVYYSDTGFLSPSDPHFLPFSLVGALFGDQYQEYLNEVANDLSSSSLRPVVSTNEETEKEFNLKVHWEVATYQDWLAQLNRRTKDTVLSELAEQLKGPIPLVGSAPGEGRQQHGPDGSQVAAVFKALEDAKAKREDPEGKRLLEHILAIFEQFYKRTPSMLNIAETLNDLGMTWSDLGDSRGAVIFFEYTLAVYKQVYQETSRLLVADTLNNLGMAWRALGDTYKSVNFLKHSLAIYEQIHNENLWHPDIAMASHNLGNAYSELGDLTRAREFLEGARTIYERGDQRTFLPSDIARNLNDLGSLYNDLDDVEKAREYLEDALAIYTQQCPEISSCPGRANTLNNLAIICYELGKLQETMSYLERALQEYQQIYGADHPFSVGVSRNLENIRSILAESQRH